MRNRGDGNQDATPDSQREELAEIEKVECRRDHLKDDQGEQQTAAWVREMFGQVAPRYDLLNHLLSFNIDRMWRARTVKRVKPVLQKNGARVLDLFAGSGALGLEALSRGAASVSFVELSPPSLRALHENIVALGVEEVATVHRGDAMRHAERLLDHDGRGDHERSLIVL